MDDRLLLIPLTWAPDPEVMEKWPATAALLDRLRSFLPVDILLWPTLKGQQVVGRGIEPVLHAMREQIRAEHHVVTLFCDEPLLGALAAQPFRSLVVSGFLPSPDRAAESGQAALATAMRVVAPIMTSPAQFIQVVMGGAPESTIRSATHDLQASVQRQVLEDLLADRDRIDTGQIGKIDVPVRYLQLPLAVPGLEDAFGYFRSLLPQARQQELKEWPLHLHEAAGGHELADKVIPFIQDVIAARASAQN